MRDVALKRPLLRPVTARAPLLDALVPAEEAYSVILFECLAQTSANAAVVLEARDSEGLHQLRIGLRRLRTALSTIGRDVPELVALNQRAKDLGLAVGAARDLDVFLETLLAPAMAELGPHSGLESLESRAQRAREMAWVATFMTLTHPDFKTFQDDVAAAASAKLWTDPLPLKHEVPVLLGRQWKTAKKRARTLDTPPERHRLRIALKKLRYTGEFFVPLYKEKAVARFMAPLKLLLDGLGHLNDGAQVRGIVGRLVMEGPPQADLSYAAGLLVGWHQAHSLAGVETMHTRWKALKKTETFWK